MPTVSTPPSPKSLTALPVKVEPRQYQKEGVLTIEALGDRALLADDMGLGKTLQALHWLRRAARRGLAPAVVVCPAIVKYMWAREAVAQVGLRAVVINGKFKKGRDFEEGDVYILNPDILPGWVPSLLARGVRLVVLDECHAYTNPETHRSRAAAALCHDKGVAGVLGISGTPLQNRPGELWHILHMIRPDMFPSRLDYGYLFCCPAYDGGRWTYPGSRNEDLLHTMLKEQVMIRRLKTDVALELPPKTRQVFNFPLSDPKEYSRAAEDVVKWLRSFSQLKAVRAERNKCLAQFGELRRLAARLKMPAVLDWVEEDVLPQVGKVVLFACHTTTINSVLERWPDAIVIDGSVPAAERQRRIDRFQTMPDPVIVGQVVAMGVGATLTAASHTVMLEMDLRPAIMCQAEDRTHRIGQTDPVWCYYPVGENTIEERVCRLLQSKQETISMVLDGAMVYNLNIFDLLMKCEYDAAT